MGVNLLKRRYKRKTAACKYLILFILIGLIILLASTFGKFPKPDAVKTKAPAVPALNTAAKIDAFLGAYAKSGYFSGSVLVAEKGKIILDKGYGMANYELNVSNTPDTKYLIGSLTKQFTAMAIMQLQEKGRLNVNDDITKYIPEYPNGKGITIHNLLTHTSGITDYVNDDKTFSEDSKLYADPQKILERFKNKPLKFKPGTKSSYSNTGYFLLGLIIERVSKKSFSSFINDNILNPLSMKATGIYTSDALLKNMSYGYGISNGKLIKSEYTDLSNFFGDGDMYSTVKDLYTWDRALYTEKLVSKSTLDMIFKNYKDEYGYGWKIADSGKHIYHVGRINGFYSYIGRFPSQNNTVIILSNNWNIPLSGIYKGVDAILSGGKYELPKYSSYVEITTR